MLGEHRGLTRGARGLADHFPTRSAFRRVTTAHRVMHDHVLSQEIGVALPTLLRGLIAPPCMLRQQPLGLRLVGGVAEADATISIFSSFFLSVRSDAPRPAFLFRSFPTDRGTLVPHKTPKLQFDFQKEKRVSKNTKKSRITSFCVSP